MRRLFALSALGLLGAALGCHTAGLCDCDGINDPCGGPPMPLHSVLPHGTEGRFDHGIVGSAHHPGSAIAGGTVIQQSPVVPNGTGGSQGTVISKPDGTGTTAPVPMVPITPKQ